MSVPTILITGANRGLGIELTRQFLYRGWRIFATCRAPGSAHELISIAETSGGRIELHELDVAQNASINRLATKLVDHPLDIVLNNAGLRGLANEALGLVDEVKWLDLFRVNAIGPLKVTEAFLPNISASDRRLVVMMTSKMASISGNSQGKDYAYRSSKAALNALTKCLALDLLERRITVVAIHPGWVRTAMGGPNASLSPAQSAAAVCSLISSLTPDDTGKFLNYDGSEIPWEPPPTLQQDFDSGRWPFLGIVDFTERHRCVYRNGLGGVKKKEIVLCDHD